MRRARLLRAFTRFYPLYSGLGTLASSRPFLRVLSGEQGLHWANLRCGARILVPIDDFVGRALYFFGDLDPKLSWICQRLLRPGDTVLDIGANLGLVSLVARTLVGASGSVHAFEPQPELVELIRQSARANGFDDIVVHPLALAEADSTLEMFVPLGNRGAASLTRKHLDVGRTVAVPVRNASDYFASLDLGPIRLVKIDVEGHEAHVIRGSERYFGVNRPDAIVFELNDHTLPFDEQPVVQELRGLDYECLTIPKALTRVRVQRIDARTRKFGHDVLAVARGDRHARILHSLGAD